MRDRVRLAYTVYIGELPGGEARRGMDSDGDGTISEIESSVYGEELAASVVKDLDVMWDGAPYRFSWSEVQMGMGTTVTDGGSFSVDLLGWICGREQATHQVSLFDRYRAPHPGESEVRVQQSPGITITRSALGRDTAGSQLRYQWQGNDGPMASLGLFLEFSVDPENATFTPPGECGAGAAKSSGQRDVAAALMAVIVIALLGGGILWRRRGALSARR